MVLFTSGKLFINSPDDLLSEFIQRYPHGSIKYSIGNFGNPPYGSTIIGPLIYPSGDNKDGCSEFTPGHVSNYTNFVMLVDRGACYFASKVRHAQDIGAKLVIIADNVGEDISRITMIDNGVSGNLYIPTLLISKTDGALIKSYISDHKDKEVSVTMNFDVKPSNDHINYTIWFSAEYTTIYEFIAVFKEVAQQFSQEQATFTPHYHTMSCGAQSCDLESCFSGGSYCAPDPDGAGRLTGRDVLYEDLRQICIYQTVKSSGYHKWFEYIAKVQSLCVDKLDEECAERVMKKVGINVKKVNKCITNSFEGKDHLTSKNSLLKSERDLWQAQGLHYYPVLVINDSVYRGDLEVSAVLEAMCAFYDSKHLPMICTNHIIVEPSEGSPESGVGGWTVLLIVFLCTMLIGAVLVWYRMWVKRSLQVDMKSHVRNTVSQYFALSESAGERRV